MTKTEQRYKAVKQHKKKMEARNSHLDFMQFCWNKDRREDPFIIGFHTREICNRIDRAFEDYRNGKSTYLVISVHHRSGKSDLVSRYLGAHFLGEFPTAEVMQVSYGAELATKFSTFGRNLVTGRKYKELYPEIRLSADTKKKNDWILADQNGNTDGKLFASGLHSGLTGSGFALGILDDYCSGREEAESLVQRDKAWDAFKDDFMSRKAPVHIVIIIATRWHLDDIIGRIKETMKNEEKFPKFEMMEFPARAEDYTGDKQYTGKYLFLERYSEDWYDTEYAILGKYSSSALLDCNPEKRLGGQLSTNGIVIEEPAKAPQFYQVKWARIWDLAHTEKQRQKDDPDYTSGTLLAFESRPKDPVKHLWVKHVYRTREGAKKRDAEIKQIADMDGVYVKQAIEDSPDCKDAYIYIRESIPQVSWNQIPLKGDKTVRATPLEAIFESPGHVHVVRGDWNHAWIDEIRKFDGTGSGHDDQVDNLSAGYIFLVGQSVNLSDRVKKQLAQRRQSR